MTPEQLAFGFLQYVVFLLSTTCHEASHALVAKWGGDTTALEGGQVSLSPIPHIKREPFGMVVVPILGIALGTGLIGWASAPYNPLWSQKHPKRAAWMSLAGPAANFTLALIAGIIMRVGLATGSFVPLEPSPAHIVGAVSQTGAADGIATVLSIFFSLNILLGVFNLIPFPPLDGYGVLGLFYHRRWRDPPAAMAREDGHFLPYWVSSSLGNSSIAPIPSFSTPPPGFSTWATLCPESR